MRQRKKNQNWITLRETNVGYVAGMTGISKKELRQLLLTAKEKRGEYEVKLPLGGTKIFTREER